MGVHVSEQWRTPVARTKGHGCDAQEDEDLREGHLGKQWRHQLLGLCRRVDTVHRFVLLWWGQELLGCHNVFQPFIRTAGCTTNKHNKVFANQ